MTEFREMVKKRVRLWTVSISLLSMITVLHFIDVFRPFTNAHYYDFISGVALGMTVAIMVIALVKIRKYNGCLKDERKLTMLFNEEHDERKQYIQNQSGGMILVICALIVFAMSLIAGFFNITVFITLLAVAYFLLFVKLCLKLYYKNKY